MTTIHTIGHSTHPVERFLELLKGAGVRRLVDVRTAPGSRKHPQFGRDALSATLRDAGITYEWWGEVLGGWRKPKPESRHTAMRSEGFRGYADHMESERFREALDALLETREETPTAVMCAEGLWWRCHRSMLADAVVARGHEARHIMPDGKIEKHKLRSFARVEDGLPVYDRQQNPRQPRLEETEG